MDALLQTGFDAYLGAMNFMFMIGLLMVLFVMPAGLVLAFAGVKGRDESADLPRYDGLVIACIAFLFGTITVGPLLFSEYKADGEPSRHSLSAVEGQYQQYSEGGIGSADTIRFAIDGTITKVRNDFVQTTITDKEPSALKQTGVVYIPVLGFEVGEYTVYKLHVPSNKTALK